jgi:predicted nuclease with TOPRIM domain
MTITGAVAVITLGIAYIKEKTDTAKRNGYLGSELKHCSESIKKLEGLPQQMTEVKDKVEAVDTRLNGLPEKVGEQGKTLTIVKFFCPAFQHHQNPGKADDCSNDQKGDE